MKDSNFVKFLKDKGENPDPLFQAIRLKEKEFEEIVVTMFLDAVQNYEGGKILEIAKAVWFLKKFKDLKNSNFEDLERAKLLIKKAYLNHIGQKWTIRQVAEYLADGKTVEPQADGFKSLRDKCKAIDFPLIKKGK